MITLHEPSAENWAGNGICVLLPAECEVEEAAGGMYELMLKHPIGDDLRARAIQRGYLIKAPVPRMETPLIQISAEGHEGQAEHEIWKVKTGAGVYSKPTAGFSAWSAAAEYGYGDKVAYKGKSYKWNGPLLPQTTPAPPGGYWIATPAPSSTLANLKADAEVVYHGSTNGTWSRVTTSGGVTGYMKTSGIEYLRTEPYIPAHPSRQNVVQPRQVREQLFRVYSVETDSAAQMVTARARHISYDLIGNVIKNYRAVNASPQDALDAIALDFVNDNDFSFYTNLTGTVSSECTMKNGIEALLDPDIGIVPQKNARLIRDNFDLFLLDNPTDPVTTGADLTVKTVAAQAGSGTPSPTNIRAITGKTPVTVTVNSAPHALTPQSALYGMAGAEDEIGNDGHETHKTAVKTLTGTETWSYEASSGRFYMSFSGKLTRQSTTALAPLKCSHFSTDYNNLDNDLTIREGGTTDVMFKYSQMAGSVTAWKSWLAAEYAADTPVQVLYHLAAPTTAQGAATEIEIHGGDTVTSADGTVIINNYTKVRLPGDRGVRISYGKNLLTLKSPEDEGDIVTRIIPLGKDKDGKPLRLPELYVDSQYKDDHPVIYAKPIEYDVQVKDATDDEEAVTEEDAFEMLREKAAEDFAKGCDLPDIDVAVDFVQLGDTEEYKAYRDLQQVFLYDTVTVDYAPMGMTFAMQVKGYTFDAVKNRYKKVVLGTKLAKKTDGVAPYQLKGGSIMGTKIALGTIDSANMRDEAIKLIHLAASIWPDAPLLENAAVASAVPLDRFVAELALKASAESLQALESIEGSKARVALAQQSAQDAIAAALAHALDQVSAAKADLDAYKAEVKDYVDWASGQGLRFTFPGSPVSNELANDGMRIKYNGAPAAAFVLTGTHTPRLVVEDKASFGNPTDGYIQLIHTSRGLAIKAGDTI